VIPCDTKRPWNRSSEESWRCFDEVAEGASVSSVGMRMTKGSAVARLANTAAIAAGS
jgi:hypothetical protein